MESMSIVQEEANTVQEHWSGRGDFSFKLIEQRPVVLAVSFVGVPNDRKIMFVMAFLTPHTYVHGSERQGATQLHLQCASTQRSFPAAADLLDTMCCTKENRGQFVAKMAAVASGLQVTDLLHAEKQHD